MIIHLTRKLICAVVVLLPYHVLIASPWVTANIVYYFAETICRTAYAVVQLVGAWCVCWFQLAQLVWNGVDEPADILFNFLGKAVWILAELFSPPELIIIN